MKQCRICKIFKPNTEFSKIHSIYKGINGDIEYWHLRLDCKSCHAENKYSKKLQREYGLTLEQFLDLLDRQNNQCAICKTVFENRSQSFVDHCHTTGKVRGLLCAKCNFGIGQFNDNIEVLSQAIEYLKA
jgi:hypothetical protein